VAQQSLEGVGALVGGECGVTPVRDCGAFAVLSGLALLVSQRSRGRSWIPSPWQLAEHVASRQWQLPFLNRREQSARDCGASRTAPRGDRRSDVRVIDEVAVKRREISDELRRER